MNTTVTQDMSFLHLITSASLPVQLVMLILVMMSFLSWWYIFRKLFVIRSEVNRTDEFEDVFWRGADLNALYQRAASSRYESGSLERIFAAGFGEFNKHPAGSDTEAVMESTRRAMRATYQREMDRLESHLSFLAATIAHVAPGIAEALIATAMGLFAAIPAVVAYNRYATAIDRLSTRFESFMEELSNVLQRRSIR